MPAGLAHQEAVDIAIHLTFWIKWIQNLSSLRYPLEALFLT